MLVPNLAAHQANAEEWVNYYYEPEVAAKLADWNYYICPVEGAQEEMLKLDKPAARSQLIFPTDEMLNTTWGFMALDDQQEIESQWRAEKVFEPRMPESERARLYDGWKQAVARVRL